MKLLVDTGALLALALKADQHHRAAADFARAHPEARFVLTELILSEVVTRLRARAGAERAVTYTRELLRSRRYELILVDAELVQGALDRMAKLADKRLSFTDCASFETINRLGLDAAFAFDRDFRDCGFEMLP